MYKYKLSHDSYNGHQLPLLLFHEASSREFSLYCCGVCPGCCICLVGIRRLSRHFSLSPPTGSGVGHGYYSKHVDFFCPSAKSHGVNNSYVREKQAWESSFLLCGRVIIASLGVIISTMRESQQVYTAGAFSHFLIFGFSGDFIL